MRPLERASRSRSNLWPTATRPSRPAWTSCSEQWEAWDWCLHHWWVFMVFPLPCRTPLLHHTWGGFLNARLQCLFSRISFSHPENPVPVTAAVCAERANRFRHPNPEGQEGTEERTWEWFLCRKKMPGALKRLNKGFARHILLSWVWRFCRLICLTRLKWLMFQFVDSVLACLIQAHPLLWCSHFNSFTMLLLFRFQLLYWLVLHPLRKTL